MASLYVGNLPYSADEAALTDALADAFNDIAISSCRIIRDRDTHKSRGYGYVELRSEDDAMRILQNGLSLEGRTLRLDLEKSRGPGGGGGGPRGGGGGGPRGGGFGGDRFAERGPRRDGPSGAPMGGPSAGGFGGPRGMGGFRSDSAWPPIDRSQPDWWKYLGRRPTAEPPMNAEGLPNLPKSYIIDMPEDAQHIVFYPCDQPIGTFPEETEKDISRGGFQTYQLGVPAGTAAEVLVLDDGPEGLGAVMEALTEPLQSAQQYSAAVSGALTFCTSYYVGPPQLANERVSAAELRAMLHEQVLRHIVVEEVPYFVERRDIVMAMSADDKWTVAATTTTIDATFHDNKLACLMIRADGSIAPDHTAANVAAQVQPGLFVSGAELDKRAGLCSMQRDGRLTVPPVQSNDARLIGDKKLDKQTNRRLEVLKHPQGWSLALGTVGEFDHSDRYPLPDRKYFELTLRRRHLLATTEGLDGDNVQEYAVIKAVILNPSRCMDVLLVLSEVPPDFAAPVDVGKATVEEQKTTLADGVEHARGVAARLPRFQAPKRNEDATASARQETERKRELLRSQAQGGQRS